MPYKNTLTITDILLALNAKVNTASAEHNSETLRILRETVYQLWDVAYTRHDPEVAKLLQQLLDNIADALAQQAARNRPIEPAAILALAPMAAHYTTVRATVLRRARRVPAWDNFGFMPDAEGEYQRVEPDWVGLTHTEGPYRVTCDLVCYNDAGRLLAWTEYTDLADAMQQAERTHGIAPAEWQACAIEITDEAGRLRWEQA